MHAHLLADMPNIEIMTYSNSDLQIHLGSDHDKTISGLIATYGTLMRFHPCLDKDARAVIMRNCSHNLTPLDLIIQNYWLESLPTLEYMEYVDITYDFTGDYRNVEMREQWYKVFFDNASNTKHTRAGKIRHFGYDRVMAGLISTKLNSNGYDTSAHYSQVFTKLYSKMQESLSSSGSNVFQKLKNEALYTYGIDEAVINFIFPDLRSGSYRHKDIENPKGLLNKTFAIEVINGGSASACHKCDKKGFETMLDNSLGKLPVKPNKHKKPSRASISKDSISKGSNSKDDTGNKADSSCCLIDIYMRDTGFYNLQYKITKFFHMENTLGSFRALPFYKLKMNSWYMSTLTISNILEGIMFINKYTFALRDKYNIPMTIRRAKKIYNNPANSNMSGGDSGSNSKEDKAKTLEKQKKPKITKKIDKHLVLCNVRSTNIDNEIEKYLAGVKAAYASDNFYPILIYPNRMNILSYYPKDKPSHKTISIHKMLELVKHKHGFNL